MGDDGKQVVKKEDHKGKEPEVKQEDEKQVVKKEESGKEKGPEVKQEDDRPIMVLVRGILQGYLSRGQYWKFSNGNCVTFRSLKHFTGGKPLYNKVSYRLGNFTITYLEIKSAGVLINDATGNPNAGLNWRDNGQRIEEYIRRKENIARMKRQVELPEEEEQADQVEEAEPPANVRVLLNNTTPVTVRTLVLAMEIISHMTEEEVSSLIRHLQEHQGNN
jgi:hypothetical protein